MLNDDLLTAEQITPHYPVTDSSLPFADYISQSQAIIKERRLDLQQTNAALIIAANSPREFYPNNPIRSEKQLKYGVLLIHGLLDCPFSVKDLGSHLQGNGIFCRSILLPGHGTRPEDLLTVTYQQWLQALRYGIDSMRKEVDHLYLAGYSTGAALSVYEALQDTTFSGLILLAPAIRIKVPMKLIVAFRYLKKSLHINHNQWIDKIAEVDYTKYLSIPFNAAAQVGMLTDAVKSLREKNTLTCPIFMAVSREDETISSEKALAFFSSYQNPQSKLLFYTSTSETFPDPRIIVRPTHYPALNIQNFSHVSIPYAPDNPHYGKHGDYEYASHHDKDCLYGAYNRVESTLFRQLYQAGLLKHRYRQLTYNPDFEFMAREVTHFIANQRTSAK